MVRDMRQLNRAAVLTELLRSRPVSRKEIAERTGISAATVTRAVDQLIEEGVVSEEGEVVVESRGRRARLLDLVADRAFVLGIDLGASKTRLIVTDLLAGPVRVAETTTPSDLHPEGLAHWLMAHIVSAVGRSTWSAIPHVSLGLPGAVGQGDRSVSNAPNLPQIEGDGFLTAFERALGKPLRVDNDANFALLGEQRFGAARHAPTAAMLTLGAGLGAGLAIDGRILQGRHGLIGEFGQLPAGPRGARLETMVTGPGILRRAAEAGIELGSPAELFVSETSPELSRLRADFDSALITVLTAVTVASEPEVIVLGGGISKSLSAGLEHYQRVLAQSLRFSPQLASAALGDFSGAVGAAVASLHATYRDFGVREEDLVGIPAARVLDLADAGITVSAPPFPSSVG